MKLPPKSPAWALPRKPKPTGLVVNPKVAQNRPTETKKIEIKKQNEKAGLQKGENDNDCIDGKVEKTQTCKRFNGKTIQEQPAHL